MVVLEPHSQVEQLEAAGSQGVAGESLVPVAEATLRAVPGLPDVGVVLRLRLPERRRGEECACRP